MRFSISYAFMPSESGELGGHGQDHARPRTPQAGAAMLTVRPLYCPAAGVPSTTQASRMRGRRHTAAKSLPARVNVNGSVVAPGKGPSRRARSRRYLKSALGCLPCSFTRPPGCVVDTLSEVVSTT
jgi:hypothetical protein